MRLLTAPSSQAKRAAQPSSTCAPCRRVRVGRRTLTTVAFQVTPAQSVPSGGKPPSLSTAASELECLSRLSNLVPDTLALEPPPGGKFKAATVSPISLTAVLRSESLGLKPFENAIVAALSSQRCRSLPSGPRRTSCVVDKAMANVGAMLAKDVEGMVANAVDPRLAHDAGAMQSAVRNLLGQYQELGVPRQRLIFRLPATWEGTQAARQLESEGVITQLFLVYSAVQGIAAMQAGVSVVQPNVGRVREWYAQHPGVVRNPKGPREDAGAVSDYDPGLELVRSLYCYGRKYHPKTKVMASGVRTRKDALELAGCDYLVMSARVMAQLAGVATDQGYNDGLSAVGGSCGVEAPLSPQAAAASDVLRMEPLTESAWRSGLGVAAAELLKQGLQDQVDDMNELLQLLEERAGGME